jgi:hypothetical protein
VCGLACPEIAEVRRIDALLAMVAGHEGAPMLTWSRCLALPSQIVISPLKESGRELELSIRAILRKSAHSVACKDSSP